MIYDFHSHTSLSDGQLSPIELISEAYSRGYQALCITDHAGIGYLPRLLQETSQDCTLASSHWNIVAIPGIELTHIPPGAIATLAKLARDAGARMVIVHGETITENVKPGTNLAAVKSPDVDILAHPGLLTMEEAKLAAANDIYIEISARKGHAFTNGHVVKIAKLAGAKLIVNSDAHDTGDLLTENFIKNVALGAGLVESELDTILNKNPKQLFEKIKKRQ